MLRSNVFSACSNETQKSETCQHRRVGFGFRYRRYQTRVDGTGVSRGATDNIGRKILTDGILLEAGQGQSRTGNAETKNRIGIGVSAAAAAAPHDPVLEVSGPILMIGT